jgi:hypothetical protein
MDKGFQNALTRIKEDDIKIEAVYELFSKITSMEFEEIVAAKNTMDLFLKVSKNIGDEEKQIIKSVLGALQGRCRVLLKTNLVTKDVVTAACGCFWGM